MSTFRPAEKEGDEFELKLEFEKGIGQLAFSRNHKALEIIIKNITPPVFPAVSL